MIAAAYIIGFSLFEAPITGGMINMARSWGPMLWLYLMGYRGEAFNYRNEYFFIYGFADLAGALVSVIFYDYFIKLHIIKPEKFPVEIKSPDKPL